MATTTNHADASNLCSGDDWATSDSDSLALAPSRGDVAIAKLGAPRRKALQQGPLRSRVVDVVDELFRYTLLLRDQQPFLLQRYSERTAKAAEKNLEDTRTPATLEVLRALKDPIIIDVRSEKEVAAAKGGRPVEGSFHVPLNVNNDPQTVHPRANFITHCTHGDSDYVGRGNRAAALLRDLGYENAYNGGSADEIGSALGVE